MEVDMKRAVRVVVRGMARVPYFGRLVNIIVAIIRLPRLQQQVLEVNHLARVFHSNELDELRALLLDVNHTVKVSTPGQLHELRKTVLDINHLAKVVLPEQVQGVLARIQILQTDQLPTLLSSISDVNSRFANFERSVPVSLRNVVRRAVQFDNEIKEIRNMVIKEAGEIAGKLEGVSRFRGELDEVREMDIRKFTDIFEKIDELSRSGEELAETLGMDAQKTTDVAERVEGFSQTFSSLTDSVGYLLGRVEFVRRELMFEMRYGAGGKESCGGKTEIKILTPEKLATQRLSGLRLNLGCGHVPLDSYLNVDRRPLPGVDIVADADSLPFADGEVSEIFSAHMLEHFPQEELKRSLLPYYFKLLKSGGILRAIVPDAQGMIDAYASGEYSFDRLREVTFGGQDYDGDFHYNMLTPESMGILLSSAGFENIEIITKNRENGGCKEFEILAVCP